MILKQKKAIKTKSAMNTLTCENPQLHLNQAQKKSCGGDQEVKVGHLQRFALKSQALHLEDPGVGLTLEVKLIVRKKKRKYQDQEVNLKKKNQVKLNLQSTSQVKNQKGTITAWKREL